VFPEKGDIGLDQITMNILENNLERLELNYKKETYTLVTIYEIEFDAYYLMFWFHANDDFNDLFRIGFGFR
jgi:hypothetical protein